MSGKVIKRTIDLLEKSNKQDKELCEYIDVAQSTFVNWKNRGTDPKPKYLSKIADFFGVSTDYLLNGTEEESFDVADEIQKLINYLTDDKSSYCYGEVMSEEGKLALLNSLKQDKEFLTALYKKENK